MNKEDREKMDILLKAIPVLFENQEDLSKLSLKQTESITDLANSINKLAEGQIMFMEQFKIFLLKDHYKDLVTISTDDYIG